ncbi:MAG: hypothetical protein A3G35_01560 [candidate division NC10 bacterium RIFCSPLOWO2_12_FULL_66_18]|nr:MAG: hypothetical protein A3H39_02865 [candidate division NC10 bacterium RIFCSPLOWO2_02_FULL_66_22]OGC01339.1 MAG: hypothetical protein A3G35_01560 [candidate division NC10 bacterium RIFCSPLOWO2_12_FULL_66_18]
MASSEEVLTRNVISLLQNSAGDESAWRAFLGIPLYRITHGHLEQVTDWSLLTIMPDSPPKSEEVVTQNLTEKKIEQKELPYPLQETDWDARGMRPDITLETPEVYATMEIKGEGGHFHGAGQPLLFARYLVLTPPGNRRERKRASLLAAPMKFFTSHRFNIWAWEAWQLEFRRLQEKDKNFYWGIILAEDVEMAINTLRS